MVKFIGWDFFKKEKKILVTKILCLPPQKIKGDGAIVPDIPKPLDCCIKDF
jgi:hypothetical protein